MAAPTFASDLELYGPQVSAPKPLSTRRSRGYCRKLARRHYENFTVASLLLPGSLRQHFYNIYAYCRWADDLADEPGNPQQSLVLLDWWERQLRECYRGNCTHPVFIALRETIQQFEIPPDPFIDLLAAFRQDQQVCRYETFDQLLNYCRYSANPVGRLILHLGRSTGRVQNRLADSICTGLQLVNFLQDVALDWDRRRIYLPIAHCLHYGYDESMFARRECNEAFRRLMDAEVSEAEGWLRRGLPLVNHVPRELKLDVALFVFGGLATLDAIRRIDFDVWNARPTLSKREKAKIVALCWWGLRKKTLVAQHAQAFPGE